VPDTPDQPLLPFDPPLGSSAGQGDARPDDRELGAEMLSARLFDEFARRTARLERRGAKPPHAA
jgi:hypothetical protein